mgnify:CR=1 FL=1
MVPSKKVTQELNLEPLPRFNVFTAHNENLVDSGLTTRLRAESNASECPFDEARQRGDAICVKQSRSPNTELMLREPEEESKDPQGSPRPLSRKDMFKKNSTSSSTYAASSTSVRAPSPRQILLARRLHIVKGSSKNSTHRKRVSRMDSPTAAQLASLQRENERPRQTP